MSKFFRNSLIGGGLLVGLIVVLRLINKRRTPKGHPEGFIEQEEQTQTGGSGTSSGVFPLKKGSQGEEVKFIQGLLNEHFSAGLPVNGNFDSATEAALISAQNSSKVRMALRVKGTPSGYRVGEVSQGLYDLLKQYA